MEAGVVVNFLNFFTDIEEEEINFVVAELQTVGLNPKSVDTMIDKIITEYNFCPESITSQPSNAPALPRGT